MTSASEDTADSVTLKKKKTTAFLVQGSLHLGGAGQINKQRNHTAMNARAEQPFGSK